MTDRCPHCGGDIELKWSWTKFIIGWINKKFVAWIVTTCMVGWIMSWSVVQEITSLDQIIAIVWGVVTVCFILGSAIDKAVENAKISAEFKAGINKEIKREKQ